MKKKTNLGITLLAAALIGMTGLVFAQGPWQGSTDMQGRDLPPEYRFTQEQSEDLEKIRAKYADKLLKVEKDLAAKQVELEATWSQPDVATSTLYDIQRQVSELEYRAEQLRLAANAEAAEILSPDQRGYFGHSFQIVGSRGWHCPWHGAVGSHGWNCPWDDAQWNAASRGWNGRSSGPRTARSCGCGFCS